MKTQINAPETAPDVLLGQRVKEIRENAQLTEVEMADALEMPLERYRDYESGAYQFLPEMMVVLSREIGCPIAFFYALVHEHFSVRDNHKIPCPGEISELLYYFTNVASPLARRKVISSARLSSSVAPVLASIRS
jgi:transcriptional regulator with XRE-family HTH domain